MGFQSEEIREGVLLVSLTTGPVHVSYLSSLLRILQAALREVALNTDGPNQRFARRPQPVLLISRTHSDVGLTVEVEFGDPLDSRPLMKLSSETFDAFLQRLSERVMGDPQLSLFGGGKAATMPLADSRVTRRMDEVYRELRRSSKVTLSNGQRTIVVEGDRVEVE